MIAIILAPRMEPSSKPATSVHLMRVFFMNEPFSKPSLSRCRYADFGENSMMSPTGMPRPKKIMQAQPYSGSSARRRKPMTTKTIEASRMSAALPRLAWKVTSSAMNQLRVLLDPFFRSHRVIGMRRQP